jgi:hypothetical protein
MFHVPGIHAFVVYNKKTIRVFAGVELAARKGRMPARHPRNTSVSHQTV